MVVERTESTFMSQKILVVDDDVKLQRLLQFELEELGLEVGLASTGEQAKSITAQSMEYYAEDPTAAGLMRSLLSGDVTNESHVAVRQMRVAIEAWWQHLLRVGQACGAVRDDLPDSLMIGLMMAICDVTDLWCIKHIDQLSRADMREMASMLINTLRRIGSAEAMDESCKHIFDRLRD